MTDPKGLLIEGDATGHGQGEERLRQVEERFALVLRGSNDGIWDWDLQTNEVYFSRRWKEMLGLPEDATGDLWRQRLHPDDAQRVLTAILAHLDGALPLYECQQRLLHADGTYRWILARGICVRDASGTPTRIAGSHTDITEHVGALQTLTQNEERHRALVEHAADGIFVHDLMGVITDVNPAACASLGYRRDELVGRPLTDIDTRLDPERIRDLLQRLWSGTPVVHEAVFRSKDGSTFPVEVRSVRFAWNGAPHVLGTVRDITRHRRDEEVLRTTKEQLEFMVENAGVAFWDWDLRTDETHYSASWRRRFGYGEEEFRGSGDEWWDILHPDDRLAVVTALQEALNGAGCYETELRIRQKDGSYRPVLSRALVVCDADGQPIRLLGAHIDITEQKRMELALREAQATLRLATESAKVAVWDCDLRALTIRFSSGWQRVLGREAGETTLVELWDLVHPDDRAKTSAAMQEHLQGRASIYETEQRMRHADGSYRWVLSRGIVACDTEGRPSHLFGADIDITERKALEEALRRSEEQYRHLVEDITDIIYAADRNGRVTYMSPVAEQLYGYTPAEVINRDFSDFIFPEDLPLVAEGFRGAISGTPQPHDHRIVTKSGEVRWVRNHARVIVQGNQIVGLQGVMSDLTERKRAETALRALTASLEQQVAERTREVLATHDQLRAITDNMFDMVSQVSLDGVFQYVSPAHERVLGYAPKQMVGRSALGFLHPDDVAPVKATMESMIRVASAGRAEFRYRCADGHYVWLETVGNLLFDDHDAPVGIVLNGRDVTEHKQAREALQTTLSVLRATLESTADGILVIDTNGRVTEYNERFQELWHIPEAVIDTHDDDCLLAHVLGQLKDPQGFRTKVRALYGQPDAESFEVLEFKDGRTFERFSCPQRVDGRSIGRVWSFRDVTQRVRNEAELRESEARYRTLVESASDAVVSIDECGIVQSVNSAAEQLFGFTAAEILGDNVTRLMPEPDAGPHDEYLAAYLRTGVAHVIGRVREVSGRRKDGTTFPLELSISEMQFGERRMFTGIMRDISARKQAEHDIWRLNAELEQRVVERTAQLEVANQELEAFSYSVSHDLRSPLRHIEGFSEMLLEDSAERLDDGGRYYLERISAGCQRMGQLIEDLLSLSRVVRHELRHAPIDLSAAARKIIAELREGQPGRDVEVVIADHLHATGDSGLLRIVLENLLGNAWKYTSKRRGARIEFGRAPGAESGLADPRFVRSAVANPSAMAFFVRDNGAGFDPARADRLFTPFRRLHSEAEFEGSGIGLAIVQRIICRHGGHVWAEAAVEQGATFYFTLPQDSTRADPAKFPRRGREEPASLAS